MTRDAFRKLALRLAGTEERAHMNHPDFRVGGRIFATMDYPKAGWAMVKLTQQDQATFVGTHPDAFVPVKGRWGELGCTNVVLRGAAAPTVRAALEQAYDHIRASTKPVRKRASG